MLPFWELETSYIVAALTITSELLVLSIGIEFLKEFLIVSSL